MLVDDLTPLIAFTGTVVLVPPVQRLTHRTGMIDQPATRKLHFNPTPPLGGVAMHVALMCVVFMFLERQALGQASAILVGSTLLFAVGLVDDALSLPASSKLGVAIPAEAGLLLVSGIRTIYPINAIIT